MKPRKSLLERFVEKVRLAEDGCWEWIGSRNGYGYGQIWSGERNSNGHSRPVAAHRVSYELFVGPVPDGLTIDHLCRNRKCVNPNHLEAVTMRVNVLRGETLAARKFAQTHCIHGHPLSGENLYLAGNGTRKCRQCRAQINLNRQQRKKPRESISELDMQNAVRRFNEHIKIGDDGCWKWQKKPDYKGAGHIEVGGHGFRVDRFAYQVFIGRIGQGLVIYHLCGDKLCVNPSHMELLTIKDGVARRKRDEANKREERECQLELS